ncbi:MAG: hypothetical protein FD160_3705 [Caulobacteraceae bacterium]|nr:MAG: hypothetical protein FD160_3705 [Caulobacteraceae bacterium]
MAKEGGGNSGTWVTIVVAAIGAVSAIGAAFIARGPVAPAPATQTAVGGAPMVQPLASGTAPPMEAVQTSAAMPVSATEAPAPAAPPAVDWRQQVLGYLDTQHKPLVDAGYAKDNGTEDWVGLLRVGTPKVWEVQLVRGVDYQVVGVCDSDCKNVDMEVYDGAGASIGADTLVDDFPRAQFRPDQSGPHTVKVWLRDCNSADGTQSCMVAARLLRR